MASFNIRSISIILISEIVVILSFLNDDDDNVNPHLKINDRIMTI